MRTDLNYSEKIKTRRYASYGMLGKQHTTDTKRKISEASQGKKNGNYGHHLSKEAKEKIRKAQTKGKIKIICKTCGKEREVYPSKIKTGGGKFCSLSCTAIWTVKHMKKKDTAIEIAIEHELIQRHIPYLKQAPVEGIALVDFLLSNKIIIQCDGDYWHSKGLNKGKDIAQDTVLYFKGYTIFRFWEKDIKKSAKKCIDIVMKNINKHKVI